MSKIFDAYKKQTAQNADLGAQVGRVGAAQLFPAPDPRLQGDLNKLAGQILGLRREDRGTLLSFASATSGEGVSFVSYNASLILARDYGQKVVWIDANFTAPQAKLRGTDGPAFSDLLQDPGRLEELTSGANPVLIPAGHDLARAKNLLASANYGKVLAGLANAFDLVILDLPPMLVSSDTALMAVTTDGLLLVIEQCNLKWEVIEHGLSVMRDKGVQTLGAVINRRSFELPKVLYDRL